MQAGILTLLLLQVSISCNYIQDLSRSILIWFDPATSWNGWGTSQGTCTVHTWNDGTEDDEGEKIGKRVNAQLEHDERLYCSSTYMGTRSRRGIFDEDDDLIG
jgi:hypothetical protein